MLHSTIFSQFVASAVTPVCLVVTFLHFSLTYLPNPSFREHHFCIFPLTFLTVTCTQLNLGWFFKRAPQDPWDVCFMSLGWNPSLSSNLMLHLCLQTTHAGGAWHTKKNIKPKRKQSTPPQWINWPLWYPCCRPTPFVVSSILQWCSSPAPASCYM